MKLDKAECLNWSFGDLLDNAIRGAVAEFIVAKALGVATGNRKGWEFADLEFAGLNIEVKSSGYTQTWHQKQLSDIRFDIKPRKQRWDADTNTMTELPEPGRLADVYVFCVLTERDKQKADPLDTDQWDFYVVATTTLDEVFGAQKTVGLRSLERVAKSVSFSEIGRRISEPPPRTSRAPPQLSDPRPTTRQNHLDPVAHHKDLWVCQVNSKVRVIG